MLDLGSTFHHRPSRQAGHDAGFIALRFEDMEAAVGKRGDAAGRFCGCDLPPATAEEEGVLHSLLWPQE